MTSSDIQICRRSMMHVVAASFSKKELCSMTSENNQVGKWKVKWKCSSNIRNDARSYRQVWRQKRRKYENQASVTFTGSFLFIELFIQIFTLICSELGSELTQTAWSKRTSMWNCLSIGWINSWTSPNRISLYPLNNDAHLLRIFVLCRPHLLYDIWVLTSQIWVFCGVICKVK
jgi:hypothetical protein